MTVVTARSPNLMGDHASVSSQKTVEARGPAAGSDVALGVRTAPPPRVDRGTRGIIVTPPEVMLHPSSRELSLVQVADGIHRRISCCEVLIPGVRYHHEHDLIVRSAPISYLSDRTEENPFPG